MADSKKISELTKVSNPEPTDEFVVVDKSTISGPDAGAKGKTSRIQFSDLKVALGNPGLLGASGNQGATGSQGDAGIKGAKGAPGPVGSQGFQGATPPKGPVGVTGARGLKGVTGPQGSQGAKGATGTRGNMGFRGTQGGTGSVGSRGAQGSQGTKGETGARGTQGSQGGLGTTGDRGTQGSKGAKGIVGSIGHKGLLGNQGAYGQYGSFASSGHGGKDNFTTTAGTVNGFHVCYAGKVEYDYWKTKGGVPSYWFVYGPNGVEYDANHHRNEWGVGNDLGGRRVVEYVVTIEDIWNAASSKFKNGNPFPGSPAYTSVKYLYFTAMLTAPNDYNYTDCQIYPSRAMVSGTSTTQSLKSISEVAMNSKSGGMLPYSSNANAGGGMQHTQTFCAKVFAVDGAKRGCSFIITTRPHGKTPHQSGNLGSEPIGKWGLDFWCNGWA